LDSSLVSNENFSKILPSCARVPKLSLAMYPFGISIDEHVSLNIDARSIFPRQGLKKDLRGGLKMLLHGGPKVPKFNFHHSELRKQLFLQKN